MVFPWTNSACATGFEAAAATKVTPNLCFQGNKKRIFGWPNVLFFPAGGMGGVNDCIFAFQLRWHWCQAKCHRAKFGTDRSSDLALSQALGLLEGVLGKREKVSRGLPWDKKKKMDLKCRDTIFGTHDEQVQSPRSNLWRVLWHVSHVHFRPTCCHCYICKTEQE